MQATFDASESSRRGQCADDTRLQGWFLVAAKRGQAISQRGAKI